MKKPLLIALIAIMTVAGIMLVKNPFRLNVGWSASTVGAINLTNDSSDNISVEYSMGGKKVNMQIPVGQTITCGSEGFVRVFTAEREGSYELVFPNDSTNRSVTLSQIMSAAKKDTVDNEIFTKKGMLGDIKVTYEELDMQRIEY